MSDLKACPFCGRIPDIEDCGEHRWFIRCKCGIAQDKLFFQKCDAVRAWNKRKEITKRTAETEQNVPNDELISRKWCTDCKEYDQERHCCPRWNRVIRNTVEELKAEHRWIPVTERLPEKKTEVIYSLDNHFVSTGYMTDRNYNGEEVELHWEDMESGALIYPEAWIPLPEPYKGEK